MPRNTATEDATIDSDTMGDSARTTSATLDWVEIGGRAETLFEIVERGSVLGHPADPSEAETTLARLRHAVSPHDEGTLARRLGWDGLTEQGVLTALRTPGQPGAMAPAWTGWIERALAAAASEPIEARALPPAGLEIPFAEIWRPFVDVAEQAVEKHVGSLWSALPQAARHGVTRPLLKQVSRQAELAVYERFHAARESGTPSGYAVFVREMLHGNGLAEVMGAHPFLARQLATRLRQWSEATSDLLLRVESDRHAIEEAFGWASLGPIVEIRAGLSDPHEDGRSVAILTFASGDTVVYKPRNVALERAVHRLIAWLSSEGLDQTPPSLRILDQGRYGWVEFAHHGPCGTRDAAESYFEAAGSLLCIAYLLNMDDLHCDNIVATPRGPALVDVEAAAQPVAPQSATDGAVPTTCLTTGLLSWIHVDSEGIAFDAGGLQPPSPRATLLPTRRWMCLGSDEIHHVPVRRRPVGDSNVARLVGGAALVPESFPAAILAGFARTYRFVLARRDALLAPGSVLQALFDGTVTRVIHRPSEQYGALLYLLAAPRYQRRGVDASIAIETLNRVASGASERPPLWPLTRDERESLLSMDVPRFSVAVDSADVPSRSGDRAPGYFARSGREAVIDCFRALGEDDLKRHLRNLATALRPAIVAAHGPSSPRTAETRLTDSARILGEEIVADAETTNDQMLWPFLADRSLTMRGDLYDGQAGIALFLAALYAATGDRAWGRASRRALAPLLAPRRSTSRFRFEGIGVASGTGSLVYALVLCARFLNDGSLLESAEDAARLVAANGVADRSFDVVGGAAGGILALLALRREGGPEWVLEHALELGHRLVRCQAETGEGKAGWAASDGLIRAGFGHGAAGAAYALLRLHAETAETAFLVAAQRAIAHERTLFSPAHSNWPAIEKSGPQIMMGWCHGAPGVGLARGLGRVFFHDEQTDDEIRIAAAAIRAAPRNLDHICCGHLSGADMLLTVGRLLGRDEWVASAQDSAQGVAERILVRGRLGALVPGYEYRLARPGFFQGLSGVGYQLLRTEAPERFPSVLGFDTGGRPL